MRHGVLRPTVVVEAGGAFSTVQDRGWPRGRRWGLPTCGALDPESLAVANALAGNAPDAAVIELTGGGQAFRFPGGGVIALAGCRLIGDLDGGAPPSYETVAVPPNGRLVVSRLEAGRFAYLAIRGGVDVPRVLGSRATYLPTGLGGFHGRRLAPGDELPLGEPVGPAPPPGFAAPRPAWMPPEPAEAALGLVPGPQTELFGEAARKTLVTSSYVVSPQSDRMGTRLRGAAVRPERDARLPSEGTCVGAMQIPDDGQPIVVLADGPTVGGYPKIGAVQSADLARFVQTPIGAAVRFDWVSVADAQQALYERLAHLEAWLAAIKEAGQ